MPGLTQYFVSAPLLWFLFYSYRDIFCFHFVIDREVSWHGIESSHKRSKDLPRAVSPGLYSPDRREISHSPADSGRLLHPELKKKDVTLER